MGDGEFSPNALLETLSDCSIDFNLMDELLYDGFWLETTATIDGPSDSWHSFLTTSAELNNNSTSPLYFPSLHDNNNNDNNNNTEPEKLHLSGGQLPDQQPESLKLSTNCTNQEADANRRLWIGPNMNPTRTVSVKKKLVQAINQLKDSIRDKDVLIQIWVPVKRGGKQVLTTNNQPFSLNPNCKNLAEYRDVSRSYQFPADEDSKEFIGLPGRVFLNKLPEWTPDVRFFKREEYPRVKHAQQHDVRGSLALPVFEQGSGTCLGVIEIVTTSQKLHYRPELENVCKALEAVDLKSSNMIPPNIEDCDESYQAALMEISNVLRCVCDAHKLPLAQTWASCVQQGKGGCRHSDENYACCVSTIDSACYVPDPQVSGFHEACSEHHLLKGEGIAGKAFLTNQPCFTEDITAFSKTEYPLAHHARVFNLHAAVAIRLRSTYTGTTDFVVEFFLPISCKEADDQRVMLDSLSLVIQRTCQSLRVVTDKELSQELSSRETRPPKVVSASPSEEQPTSSNASFWDFHTTDPQKVKGKSVAVSFADQQEERGEFKVTTEWDNLQIDPNHHAPESLNHDQFQQDSILSGGFSAVSEHLSSCSKISKEKRRTKAEKTISLQVLRQYFSGSLRDAAKAIGVCPTTLKRICRQHGITRWPSRKIKKVGHSLRKLQLVIDSVQGADGSIQLSSFYNKFPELVPPNTAPGNSNHLSLSNSHSLQVSENQPEGILQNPVPIMSNSSSSSGSQSSGSSYSCSAGVKPSSFLGGNQSSSGDAPSAEQTSGGRMLKRAHSDIELHQLGEHEDTKLLVRSRSHKTFNHHISEVLPPPLVPKNGVSGTTFRIKATFGEERVRLSLQPHWGFKDLKQEVLRRFNILDSGPRVDLKYLDDDAEWVLLTCDADVEECIDIHRSSKSRTIKLSICQPHHHPSLGSSYESNGPC